MVHTIATALNREGAPGRAPLSHPASAYVNALVAPEGSSIAVDEAALAAIGVHRVEWVPSRSTMSGQCFFDAEKLVTKLRSLLAETELDVGAREAADGDAAASDER
jgi:hypothetical protein